MRITGGGVRLAASDVANFLACQHLTRLDLLMARGELYPPYASDLGFRELVERGEAHERAVLDRFRADGCRVVEIAAGPETDAAQATLDAIGDGPDVIYQGVLQAPALLGRPDFLVRAGLLDAPAGYLGWQVRGDHLPLGIGQVTGIAPGPPPGPPRTLGTRGPRLAGRHNPGSWGPRPAAQPHDMPGPTARSGQTPIYQTLT
jgi:hypothetical protein